MKLSPLSPSAAASDRPVSPTPALQPPNILLLVLDTQRADRLSCYGYGKATSPHLDAFAQDSTRFNHAIAPAQWTIPSHASMFTGSYPSEHQVLQSYSVLPESLPTLAERLQAGGYFTAGFCNNPLVGIINNGLRRGFYSFLNYSGLLTDRPNQAGSHPGWVGRYRQFFKRCLATVLSQVQDAFARSEWLLSLSLTPLMVPLWQTALSFKGNTAKSLGDAARLLVNRQIDRQTLDPQQPIFAFINLMGTHMPYHPPRRYVAQFAPHVLQDKTAQHYLRHFNSDVYGWLAPLAGALNPQQKATLDGMYDAEVAHQDEQLGQFFQTLKAGGVLDNTVVMICSDHGEHLGEKQFIGHSLSIYNELVQVPLIIRDPQGQLPPGSVVEETVSTRRLFHTALAAAGLATAAEQALSLVPVGRGTASTGAIDLEAIGLEAIGLEATSIGTNGVGINGVELEAANPEAQVASRDGAAAEGAVAVGAGSRSPATEIPAPLFDPVFSEAIPPQNVVNLLRKRQPQLIRDRACDQPRRAVWAGSHKLIETGNAATGIKTLELYDIHSDPTESLNLRDILPENVEVLQDCLLGFSSPYPESSPDGSAGTLGDRPSRAPGFDDPEVQQRLRDLGYLEE